MYVYKVKLYALYQVHLYSADVVIQKNVLLPH